MLVCGLSSVEFKNSLVTGISPVRKGETNNPMKLQFFVACQEKFHADLARSCWGLKITPGSEDQDGGDKKSIPACISALPNNFAYDLIHIDKTSPRLTKFARQFPFKGHVGTAIVDYEYQFVGDPWLKMGPTYNTGNDWLTGTQLGLPTDVSYTTSNQSNYESYQRKPGLIVTSLACLLMHKQHAAVSRSQRLMLFFPQ
ncbi:hypothetical protein MRX96_049507 [Rhipicephalus microplus]